MGELIVVSIVVLFFVVLPIFVIGLGTRVKNLEQRLNDAEKAVARVGSPKAEVPSLGVAPLKESAMKRAKEESRVEPVVSESVKDPASPPPLPVFPEKKVEREEPKRAPAAAVEAAEGSTPIPVMDRFDQGAVMDWLERVGLMPPSAGEEGTNLVGWWSTRVGLALGVIAAVFFGMYVNQNTVPLVRLLELVAVAVAVVFFAGGCWMEKKLPAFGRALSAGGLALLYVAAYASYGLEAMKVLDDPLTGSLVQVLAVGLMGAWAVWRSNEGIFALALALGYVTSWFSYQEGVEPLPLISFLVLAAGGSALFALRGWWSGIWGGLCGSSGGLFLLAVFRWQASSGPSEVVGLGAACLLTVILLAGLYVRKLKGEPLANPMLPLITSVGVVVGAVVTWALDIEWEWYYATYAVLLLVVGWLWKGGEEDESMWEVMWAKASVFIALFLIAKFDGPVRAYGLLAQAGSLAFLARRKDWLIFDLGALLAMVIGWLYVQRELPDGFVTSWGAAEVVVLAYLFSVLGLLAYFGPGKRFEREREVFVGWLTALLAIGVVWVGVFRVDHDWALFAGLFSAGVFLWVGRVAKIWKYELLALVFLLPTLLWLLGRGMNMEGGGFRVEGVALQSLVWLAAAWVYCLWMGMTKSLSNRAACIGVMLSSIIAVVLVGHELFGGEWVPVVLLGLGVLWLFADKRVPIPDLMFHSGVAAAFGAMMVLGHWLGEMETSVLVFSVLLALVYWGSSWLLHGENVESGEIRISEVVRGGVLGAVLLTALNLRLEGAVLVMAFVGLSSLLIGGWRQLKDRSLPWVAVISACLGFGNLFEARASDGWHELSVAVIFVLFVCNGLALARSGRKEVMADPKLVSLGWGFLAMVSVLVGLALEGQVAGWTTAFWAVGAVALLAAGFWGGLRGYRVIGLLGIGCAILRLFTVDVQETFWRIVAFGVTGALLVGIGYIYSRFHRRLAALDLDWKKE